MKNELCVKGFSEISEIESTNINGGAFGLDDAILIATVIGVGVTAGVTMGEQIGKFLKTFKWW
ncbi:MAG: hypothetical protein IJ688_03700 [Treponema sp.]|nr:hypothetical protein [Treponema sp.]